MDPPKNQVFERLKLGCQFFFDISTYLTDKYFDIVWRCHPPADPQNQFFEQLNFGCQGFLIAVDI